MFESFLRLPQRLIQILFLVIIATSEVYIGRPFANKEALQRLPSSREFALGLPGFVRSGMNSTRVPLPRAFSRVVRLVLLRISRLARAEPRFSTKVIASVSPRELPDEGVSRRAFWSVRDCALTLMRAVVAPMAAATGRDGNTRAPTHGKAVPMTVPPSAVAPAAIKAYFYVDSEEQRSAYGDILKLGVESRRGELTAYRRRR